ncbi:MAG: MoaD/ThiS family protein [Planctomycetes bacterium]|nr:MoaD/ThiS family protein [Planctomycetota bacterium]
MKLRIAVTGRGYHQAQGLPGELTLAEGASVEDALGEISGLLGDRQALPPACLVSLAGRHLGTLGSYENALLNDGDELVLIAPVAGG